MLENDEACIDNRDIAKDVLPVVKDLLNSCKTTMNVEVLSHMSAVVESM